MGTYGFLIWKNLRRNLRRSVLTVLSIAVSLFLVGVLLAVYATMYHREASEDSTLRMITRHKVSLTQALPYYYGDRIEEVAGVEILSPMNWFGGIYIDESPENFFARFAVDPERVFEIYAEYDIAPEQLEAFQRDRQAIAIGSTVAQRTGLKLGQRITIQGDIYPGFDPELTVRAIFQGPDDFQSFFHYKYLEEGVKEAIGHPQVGVFAMRIRSADDASRITQAVDDMFRNSPQPTKTETEAAFQLQFIEQLGNVKLFLLAIGAAVVFTMLMVSGNTIAMSVRERTREIGVLKTLGFPAPMVLNLVLGEAVAIALLGGLLGAGGAAALMKLLEGAMVQFFTGFFMPLWAVGVCMAVALVVGLASSSVPALLAARTNTVDALRHTG